MLRIYLRVLAVLYAFGAALHLLDVLNLRLEFSEMTAVWKFWILFLLIADISAAVGLWKIKRWGIALFLFIASAQLVAYTAFSAVFGNQGPLIIFHLVTIVIFFFLQHDSVLKSES